MSTDAGLPAFQRYQLQFTSHIRDPKGSHRPPRVAANRMKVYTEIVFNNLEGSVSACFPVTKRVLGQRKWQRLVRGFFRDHRSHSPLFRQIPEEFLRYLNALDAEALAAYPPFLQELAHYEWVELAIAVADVAIDPQEIDPDGDLLDGRPVFAPALALLSYRYPVQRISPRFKPIAPLDESVHLLVYRDPQDQVKFIELNAVTARLLAILQAELLTGRQALEKLANELKQPSEMIIQFGQTILGGMKQELVVLGIANQNQSG